MFAAVGDCLAFLKEWEATDVTKLRASGIATRIKTAPDRSPLMNKPFPFLLRESVNGGRKGSRSLVFLFQKTNTGI